MLLRILQSSTIKNMVYSRQVSCLVEFVEKKCNLAKKKLTLHFLYRREYESSGFIRNW